MAGSDGDLLDLAGEAGAEGDHPGAVSGVDVLEHTLAGEHFREHPPQSTAMGLHLHIRAHPDHGATLRDHLLAVFQLTDHHGEGSAFDFITHGGILLTIFRQRREEPPPCVSWYGSSIAEKRNERKKKIYPKPYTLQEAAQDSVVSGSLRRVLTKRRKYTRCSVCRADSVLHFAGILGSGGLADAQPDEKIPEHLILFIDALSDPAPQSRQMDGLGWRCLAERRCPWNTAADCCRF